MTETGSVNALIHVSQAVIRVPSTAIVAGGGLREGVANRKRAPGTAFTTSN